MSLKYHHSKRLYPLSGFVDHYTSVTIITDIVVILLKCVTGSYDCLKKYSLVHCHYDKRSKGIISAIGSLEKPLILQNFAHLISVSTACLAFFLVSFCSSHRFTPNCHPRLRSKVNLCTLILLAIISPT